MNTISINEIDFDEDEESEDLSNTDDELPNHFPFHYDNLMKDENEFKRVSGFNVEMFNDVLFPILESSLPREHPRGGKKFSFAKKRR